MLQFYSAKIINAFVCEPEEEIKNQNNANLGMILIWFFYLECELLKHCSPGQADHVSVLLSPRLIN